MELLRNHVWLAGLLVMLVNIIIGRVRMRGLIAGGELTAPEANRFCINAAVVVAVACGLFQVATSSTGLAPECQLLLPITHRSLWPSYGITLFSGAALLYWVWRRGGDRTLAKVGPAFTRGEVRGKRYTPRQVRFWLTALPVVAWGGFIAIRLTMPMPTLAEMPLCAGPAQVAAQPGVEPDGASRRRLTP